MGRRVEAEGGRRIKIEGNEDCKREQEEIGSFPNNCKVARGKRKRKGYKIFTRE